MQMYDLLSSALTYLRTYCSIRYLVNFLPAGSSAPRLKLYNIIPRKYGTRPYVAYHSPSSDVLYTSSFTDWDDADENTDVNLDVNNNNISNNSQNYNSIHHLESNLNANLKNLPNNKSKKLNIFNSSNEKINIPIYYVGSLTDIKLSNDKYKTKEFKVQNNTNDIITKLSTQSSINSIIKNKKYKSNSKNIHKNNNNSQRNPRKYRNRHHHNHPSNSRDLSASCESDSFNLSSFNHYSSKQSDSDRISQLEAELSRLRSELAQLILIQETRSMTSDLEHENLLGRPDADGESDTSPNVNHTNNSERICLSQTLSMLNPSVSFPPPPPPPPMLPFSPPKQNYNWKDQLKEKLKMKKGEFSTQTSTPNNKAPRDIQSSGNMSEVLKELQTGSIKLRSIPRSPGGTPLRSRTSPIISGLDPCAIINRALNKKFAHLRSVLDHSDSGDENNQTLNSSTQSSKQIINSESITIQHKQHKSPINNNNKYKCSSPSIPFGQHMLRSVGSRTVALNISLNE